MQFNRIQDVESYNDSDFFLLYIAHAYKNDIYVINLTNLEKQLYRQYHNAPIVDMFNLRVDDLNETINLRTGIVFATTLGVVQYHIGTDKSRRLAILCDDKQADEIIANYDTNSNKKVGEVVGVIYPKTNRNRSTSRITKRKFIKIY